MAKSKGFILITTLLYLSIISLVVFVMFDKVLVEMILHQQYQSYIINQDEFGMVALSLQSRIANNETNNCLVPFVDELQYKKQSIIEKEKLSFCQQNYRGKIYFYQFSDMQELPCASFNGEAGQAIKIYQVFILKEKKDFAIAYIAAPVKKDTSIVCTKGSFLPSVLLSVRRL